MKNIDQLSKKQNYQKKIRFYPNFRQKDQWQPCLPFRFDRQNTPALRKRVIKTLKELEGEERVDFGRHRGSYYGGKGSLVGKELAR